MFNDISGLSSLYEHQDFHINTHLTKPNTFQLWTNIAHDILTPFAPRYNLFDYQKYLPKSRKNSSPFENKHFFNTLSSFGDGFYQNQISNSVQSIQKSVIKKKLFPKLKNFKSIFPNDKEFKKSNSFSYEKSDDILEETISNPLKNSQILKKTEIFRKLPTCQRILNSKKNYPAFNTIKQNKMTNFTFRPKSCHCSECGGTNEKLLKTTKLYKTAKKIHNKTYKSNGSINKSKSQIDIVKNNYRNEHFVKKTSIENCEYSPLIIKNIKKNFFVKNSYFPIQKKNEKNQEKRSSYNSKSKILTKREREKTYLETPKKMTYSFSLEKLKSQKNEKIENYNEIKENAYQLVALNGQTRAKKLFKTDNTNQIKKKKSPYKTVIILKKKNIY